MITTFTTGPFWRGIIRAVGHRSSCPRRTTNAPRWTDYDRMPEDIDGGRRVHAGVKTYHNVCECRHDAGREFARSRYSDSVRRRCSEHEARQQPASFLVQPRRSPQWYWQCPHCGEYFQPIMEVMSGYRNSRPGQGQRVCAYVLPSLQRHDNGRYETYLEPVCVWLREGESIDAEGNRIREPRRSRIASF